MRINIVSDKSDIGTNSVSFLPLSWKSVFKLSCVWRAVAYIEREEEKRQLQVWT